MPKLTNFWSFFEVNIEIKMIKSKFILEKKIIH